MDKMTQGLQGNDGIALLVTGIKPQVGATTVLVNLAVAASRKSERRIVLVDAHAQRPGIAPRFGLKPELALQDVLAGNAALEDAMFKLSAAALHVLPAKEARDETPLTHEAAAWLVGLLCRRFGLVLIDGPTLDDAALSALASTCTALYLVAPQGESQLDRRLVQNLTRSGAKLRGLLHTHLE
jgi:tyrosine-protein kinase Etk/Wzc